MDKKTFALRGVIRNCGIWLALIVLVFTLLRPESFGTLNNFLNITRQISLLVMISLGATMVMSVGEFDLSVGGIASLGGNEEAARIAGIRVERNKTAAFVLCAMMACVTGMLIASRVGSANTSAGEGYFLQSYAAVFIGCTASRKGVPNAVGTLAGAAILGGAGKRPDGYANAHIRTKRHHRRNHHFGCHRAADGTGRRPVTSHNMGEEETWLT